MTQLTLDKITKRFNDVHAIDAVSLTVAHGELMCLLGPSGCGKTTTLRAIAGFESLDAGAVRIDGVDITAMPPEQRNIGIVFQSYALFPHMTVGENIAFGLKMRRRSASEIRTAVAEALRLVRLGDVAARLPHQLSGGQQQRVALARAIAIRPQLLLLDEPLSNLDAKLRDEMREEIRRVQREVGITAIMVTHDQSEALSMADRMAVMSSGRIVQVDTPAAIYRRPTHPFVAGFIGQANLLPGRVVACDGGMATVATAAGSLRGVAVVPPTVGSAVVCVVKTEHVSLAATPGEGPGPRLPVRVDARSFLGPTVVYTCESGAVRIIAALPHRSDRLLELGTRAWASWEAQDCLVLEAE